MTNAELIVHLQTFPPEAEVVYKDMNFGGPDKYAAPLLWEFVYEEGKVCIPSDLWEPCD